MVCRRFGTLYQFHLQALEDGSDRGFRNVGKPQSDAAEIPKRILTRFKTRRKFEINKYYLFDLSLLLYLSDIQNEDNGTKINRIWKIRNAGMTQGTARWGDSWICRSLYITRWMKPRKNRWTRHDEQEYRRWGNQKNLRQNQVYRTAFKFNLPLFSSRMVFRVATSICNRFSPTLRRPYKLRSSKCSVTRL